MKKALALSVAALAMGTMLSTPAQATALGKTKAERLAMALTLTKNTKASYNAWARFKTDKNTTQVKEFQFNWNTDGCSVPDGVPSGSTWGAVFKIPCWRHDFGYRNVKALASSSAWKTYKKEVDSAFLGDMKRLCDSRSSSSVKRAACKAVAYEFYTAVKYFA